MFTLCRQQKDELSPFLSEAHIHSLLCSLPTKHLQEHPARQHIWLPQEALQITVDATQKQKCSYSLFLIGSAQLSVKSESTSSRRPTTLFALVV